MSTLVLVFDRWSQALVLVYPVFVILVMSPYRFHMGALIVTTYK